MRILVGTMIAVTLVAVSSFAADQTSLSVGRVQAVSSVPVELVTRMRPELKLIDATQWRSEALPSTTPLPDSLSELPDVVSALVGFYDNDIPYLCQKGFIEPLDSVFAELGLDPKAVIPPNLYEAVAWKEHVWALPYRVDSYVLRYRKDEMQKVGAATSFANWNEVFAAAEKISLGADPDRQVSGFFFTGMADEQIGSCLMAIGMDAPPGAAGSLLGLLAQYHARGVFWPPDFTWAMLEQESGIRCVLFRSVTVGANVGIVACPDAVVAGSAPTLRPVGFAECYALRKNTPEKLQAAREFIKLLLSKEAQLALLEATQIDKAPSSALAFRHVPVFKHVTDSTEFKEVLARIPTYGTLLDIVKRARFTPVNPEAFEALRTAILKRFSEVMPEVEEPGEAMVPSLMKVLEPIQVQPNAPAAAPDVSRY